MKRLAPLFSILLLFGCDDADKKNRPLILEDVHLKRFSSCDEMKKVLEEHRQDQTKYVEALPLNSDSQAPGAMPAPLGETNLQVAGVDELDVAKADGEFIYRLAPSSLQVLRRSPASQASVIQEISSSDGSALGLFITANRLIMLTQVYDYTYDYTGEPVYCEDPMPLLSNTMSINPCGGTYEQKVMLRYFERKSDGTLAEKGNRSLDGTLETARLIGDRVHLVLSNQISPPVSDEPVQLPVSVLDGNSTNVTACDAVLHEPAVADDAVYSPYPGNLTCVLSANVNDEGDLPRGECVVTDYASVVYASGKNLFLASYGWTGQTPIHQFRLAEGSEDTRYIGSAVIEGSLLNQFSMDEFDGHLRLATNFWPPPASCSAPAGEVCSLIAQVPQNRVQTFKLGEGDLDPKGLSEDFGSGESIFAVRFLGKNGFVVTFRQTDPLFALDLSDASNPRLRGALEIPGVSTYLHPIGDDYLIGVGSDSGAWGPVGLSLFDVRDLDHPKRIHKMAIDGWSWSEAAYEHKAFRYIPEKEMVVLPVEASTSSGFHMYKASVSTGFSLAGTSAFPANSYAYSGNRSFYRDGMISLVGGGELVVRDSSTPDMDAARVAIE